MSEVTLVNCESAATINLQGAHVTSWRVRGKEQLYMMPSPKFDGHSEVFGGIPIIFPRLGGWGEGKPLHGFARTATWKKAASGDGGDANTVTLVFESSAFTRSIFDAEFSLELNFSLGESHLTLDLNIENRGEKSFEFTALFHNYIYVEDVRLMSLHGLADTDFKNAADG